MKTAKARKRNVCVTARVVCRVLNQVSLAVGDATINTIFHRVSLIFDELFSKFNSVVCRLVIVISIACGLGIRFCENVNSWTLQR